MKNKKFGKILLCTTLAMTTPFVMTACGKKSNNTEEPNNNGTIVEAPMTLAQAREVLANAMKTEDNRYDVYEKLGKFNFTASYAGALVENNVKQRDSKLTGTGEYKDGAYVKALYTSRYGEIDSESNKWAESEYQGYVDGSQGYHLYASEDEEIDDAVVPFGFADSHELDFSIDEETLEFMFSDINVLNQVFTDRNPVVKTNIDNGYTLSISMNYAEIKRMFDLMPEDENDASGESGIPELPENLQDKASYSIVVTLNNDNQMTAFKITSNMPYVNENAVYIDTYSAELKATTETVAEPEWVATYKENQNNQNQGGNSGSTEQETESVVKAFIWPTEDLATEPTTTAYATDVEDGDDAVRAALLDVWAEDADDDTRSMLSSLIDQFICDGANDDENATVNSEKSSEIVYTITLEDIAAYENKTVAECEAHTYTRTETFVNDQEQEEERDVEYTGLAAYINEYFDAYSALYKTDSATWTAVAGLDGEASNSDFYTINEDRTEDTFVSFERDTSAGTITVRVFSFSKGGMETAMQQIYSEIAKMQQGND